LRVESSGAEARNCDVGERGGSRRRYFAVRGIVAPQRGEWAVGGCWVARREARLLRLGDQAGQKRGRRRWVPAGSGAGDVVGVCRARRTAAMERFSFREDERRLRLRSAKKAGPETGRNRCGEAACTSPVACSRLILAALLIASPLQGVPPPVCMLRNSQAQALRARRTTRARLRCETAVRCALRRATMPMPLSRPNADRPPTSR
jgi:hypothetical protein